LCVHAMACYSIAWKTHTARLRLDMTSVYACLISRYVHEKNARGLEQFEPVLVPSKRKIFGGYVGAKKRIVVTQLNKTRQGLSVERAEMSVLQECGWRVHMSTMVDVVDTLLAISDHALAPDNTTAPPLPCAGVCTDTRAQLRIVAFDRSMRLTMDTKFMFNSSFSVIKGAIVALCEAAMVVGVKMDDIAGLQMLST